jgi:hypothetical protein
VPEFDFSESGLELEAQDKDVRVNVRVSDTCSQRAVVEIVRAPRYEAITMLKRLSALGNTRALVLDATTRRIMGIENDTWLRPRWGAPRARRQGDSVTRNGHR